MNTPNDFYGVKGVAHLYQEQEVKGEAKVSRFSFSEEKNPIYNLRIVRDCGLMFKVFTGEYVRLTVGGELVMSDTPMERYTNKEFLSKANGRVLIAGLGLGMIIENLKHNRDVKSITVVEKSQDVIDLISPKITVPNVKYICADIFDWIPPVKEKYDTIYFDIWANISESNLKDMQILHNKFKGRLNRENDKAFMNSWMKEYLRRRRNAERRDMYKYNLNY